MVTGNRVREHENERTQDLYHNGDKLSQFPPNTVVFSKCDIREVITGDPLGSPCPKTLIGTVQPYKTYEVLRFSG